MHLNRVGRRDAKTLVARLCVAALIATLLSACPSTSNQNQTLFQSSFNATPVGQPPASAQSVGTVATQGNQGSVVVVGPPKGSTASDRWVQIEGTAIAPGNYAPNPVMICNLSQTAGPGHYGFLAAMYMPSVPAGAKQPNVASISFASQADLQAQGNVPTGFMHLDLGKPGPAPNTITISDTVGTSVTFPRDQPFDLSVQLFTQASPPTAQIGLIGPNTSGSFTYTLPPDVRADASQFGAVVLWMGFPWLGPFQASAIAVTKYPS